MTSVFERLSKTETASSSGKRNTESVSIHSKRHTETVSSSYGKRRGDKRETSIVRNKALKQTKRESVFDRLSKTETVSSSGKFRGSTRGTGVTKSQVSGNTSQLRTSRIKKGQVGTSAKLAMSKTEKMPQCSIQK